MLPPVLEYTCDCFEELQYKVGLSQTAHCTTGEYDKINVQTATHVCICENLQWQ